jgi:hypothetical protein
MNELDMVRALRADAPQPSADRLAAGRDLLRTAIVPARRPLPRSRPVMITIASAAAAAAVAAAVLLPATRAGVLPRPPTATSGPRPAQLLSVTVVLGRAAAAAERRPAVMPGPRQWLYEKGVKAVKGEGEAGGGRGRFVSEGWTRFDGEQSADISRGRLVVLPYGPAQDGVSDATPQGAARYLRSLPASPAALLKVIYRKADTVPRDLWAVPGNRDSEAFSLLMTMLYNAPAGVPAAVQATVFRATALIPGVHVGKAADALGRTALALSGAGLNGSFLLDPGSYALIGLRSGGAVITRIDVAVVDGPGQR